MILISCNKNLSSIEKTACEDLKTDLIKVIGKEIKLILVDLKEIDEIIEEYKDSQIIYIDTFSTLGKTNEIINLNELDLSSTNPGSRGGLITKIRINTEFKKNILALLGR